MYQTELRIPRVTSSSFEAPFSNTFASCVLVLRNRRCRLEAQALDLLSSLEQMASPFPPILLLPPEVRPRHPAYRPLRRLLATIAVAVTAATRLVSAAADLAVSAVHDIARTDTAATTCPGSGKRGYCFHLSTSRLPDPAGVASAIVVVAGALHGHMVIIPWRF